MVTVRTHEPAERRREQVRRLPHQQDAPVGVREVVRDELQELVGRHPRRALGVAGRQDGVEPRTHAVGRRELLGVVPGDELQVDPVPAGERLGSATLI